MTTGAAPPDAPAAVLAAIERAYDDAGLAPPTVASASRVVPLLKLLADQPLCSIELGGLTTSKAAAFLEIEAGHQRELAGQPTTRLSGYFHATARAGYILVPRDEPVVQRRFTIAHELGHYLLHALPLFRAGVWLFSEMQASDSEAQGRPQEAGGATRIAPLAGQVWVEATGMLPPPDMTDWEGQADQFAAALLMPSALCRDLVAMYGAHCGRDRAVLAGWLADELLVSEAAMLRRLTVLGLGEPGPRAGHG